MKKKSTEREQCSLFEEMLMWTSYRYCIGRHTYVTSLAGEIAQHYYNRLSDERMEFTATDIRKEISDKLQWLPFNFKIHRMYDSDPFNPLDALLTFIQKNNIDTIDELYKEAVASASYKENAAADQSGDKAAIAAQDENKTE